MPPQLATLPVESGTPVLVRVDYNVPVSGGEVSDDTRIRASLPTLAWLRERGAKVVLCSHMGRPKGQRNPALSLEPAAARLAEILDDEVWFAHDSVGEDVEELVKELPPGGILMVENLRFNAGEVENDAEFATRLARLGRLYVNDSFSSIHRSAASVVGVVSQVEAAATGLHVENELSSLGRLLSGPERPFVAILGGPKVADKMGLLESLARRCDALLLGGAMAYTFLAAQGKKVGRTRFENEKVLLARRLLERCAERSVTVYLPVDHVVAEKAAEGAEAQVSRDIPDAMSAFDIGPETIARYQSVLSRAGTVFWEGSMGSFEEDRFSAGTRAVAESIAGIQGCKVVGGGDAVTAVQRLGLTSSFTHVSTGGAATLEFIEGRELPGIRALRLRSNRT